MGGHLVGAMKSIADEWSNKKLEGKLHKVRQEKEGQNPIDNLASSDPEIEENFAAKEEIERIGNDLILFLIWWKDEQQILDIEEDEEHVEDNWDLKWK